VEEIEERVRRRTIVGREGNAAKRTSIHWFTGASGPTHAGARSSQARYLFFTSRVRRFMVPQMKERGSRRTRRIRLL
jgi:hypothetical protein